MCHAICYLEGIILSTHEHCILIVTTDHSHTLWISYYCPSMSQLHSLVYTILPPSNQRPTEFLLQSSGCGPILYSPEFALLSFWQLLLCNFKFGRDWCIPYGLSAIGRTLNQQLFVYIGLHDLRALASSCQQMSIISIDMQSSSWKHCHGR